MSALTKYSKEENEIITKMHGLGFTSAENQRLKRILRNVLKMIEL